MPNRIIKEAIRTSRDVNNLNDFQFRVWAYLITYVDDYGRGSADPELLKGLVFPRRKGITERQIGEALSVLASNGMVTLYNVDGEPYFYFPAWEKHQTVRAAKSKFPAPQASEQVQADASGCMQPQADAPGIQSNPESNPNPNANTTPQTPQGALRGQEKASMFDTFWEVYPRKVGKGAARKAWDKLDLTWDLVSTILDAVSKQQTWAQWTRDGGQYIPHPATWLNQQRWEDEGMQQVNAAQKEQDQWDAWIRGDIE